ncbi:MAG: type II toxin-antitoxin system prevent-host-death family antitoxin [Thermodesulfobacteriota bacterium]
MKWTIAHARQHFAELLRQAAQEPQEVCNRGRPVATVVDVETFREYCRWRDSQTNISLAHAFEELRALCAEESYTLECPERQDRANPWAEGLHELPR